MRIPTPRYCDTPDVSSSDDATRDRALARAGRGRRQTAAHAEAQQLGEDAAAVAADLDAAGDRIVDHLDDIDDQVSAWDERTDASGSNGIAVAVAGLNVTYLMVLPVLLVVGIYTFITVYAIVKAVSSGSDSADAGVILLGVVGLVTLFVVLLGWAAGSSAEPPTRRSAADRDPDTQRNHDCGLWTPR